MKVGIIGTGAVGSACALSVIHRGCARELVLWDRTRQRAKAVATDMRYGAALAPSIEIRNGDFEDFAGAALVMITAGINEKTGGATNRADPAGRLRLLQTNARVYEELVPQLVKAAPKAVILVVTDPPDPLADLARNLAGHDAVLSTGTLLDSLRFRVHLAQELGVAAGSIEASVVGEHGTSSVFLWYSARVGGVPLRDVLGTRKEEFDRFRQRIENDVRYANITIIEGNEASQYGIGIVSARVAEAILRNENAVMPIGCYNSKYGVTLSLPSVVGRTGVRDILDPEMTDEERQGVQHSAETLRHALDSITATHKRPAA